MALWDNSTIAGNDSAHLWNKMVREKAYILGLKRAAFVAFMLGYQIDGDPTKYDFNQVVKKPLDGGKKLEVTFATKRAMAAAVGYGAGERAAPTISTEASAYGAAVFDIANYSQWYYWEKSTFDTYKGRPAKMQVKFLTQEFARILAGRWDQWETWLAGAVGAAPSPTQLGSILNAMVADNYGGIDRTVGENADLLPAGNRDQSATPYTLADFRSGSDLVWDQLADKVVAFAGTTAYNLLAQKIEDAAAGNQTMMKDDTLIYGGSYFIYNNVAIVRQHRMPAGEIWMVDPMAWEFYQEGDLLATTDEQGIRRVDNAIATMGMPIDCRAQLINVAPNRLLREHSIAS